MLIWPKRLGVEMELGKVLLVRSGCNLPTGRRLSSCITINFCFVVPSISGCLLFYVILETCAPTKQSCDMKKNSARINYSTTRGSLAIHSLLALCYPALSLCGSCDLHSRGFSAPKYFNVVDKVWRRYVIRRAWMGNMHAWSCEALMSRELALKQV